MDAPDYAAPPAPTQDERNMGLICHLLAFCGLAFPFGNLLGPLIFWLIEKDESPFVDACGKEQLNFQISMSLWIVIATVLVLLLVGIILLILLAILNIVLVIIGALKARDGEVYRFPLTIRLLQ